MQKPSDDPGIPGVILVPFLIIKVVFSDLYRCLDATASVIPSKRSASREGLAVLLGMTYARKKCNIIF
jgi:hypothetical protein